MQRWCQCYYPKSWLLPQVGGAYFIQLILATSNKNTKGQIYGMSFLWQTTIFIFYWENRLLLFDTCSKAKEFFTFLCTFLCKWDIKRFQGILTIKTNPLCVKSNIINFYIFVIPSILTKEWGSLWYLAIFFGFHLHYVHYLNLKKTLFSIFGN